MRLGAGDRARASGRPEAACARLTLALLQGFRLELDGGAVELPLGTQRLVAFLAVHDRPLQRLFVAGNLWIDSNEEHANANLRTALWRLRHLGYRIVDATRSHLALAPSVAVDLHESTARARRVLRREDSSPLEEAQSVLLAGDLLPDWYDDWVVIERERFRQLRLHALETLCEDLAASGSYAAAVEAGLACVAAEPLRESAHRALIRVHLAESNVVEAVRQYRLYRALLRDGLGLAPSAEMERIIASLPVGDGVVTRAL
jgi:DNA-binding SARP family transcriptional activator